MRVNEIFYSIQGEGYHAGTAAVFVRFSGCNLKCPFCDTDFTQYTEMTEEEITDEVAKYDAELCVITGGEPTLQLTESLVDKLHAIGKYVAIETNGTRPIPKNVDWITCSPKNQYQDKAEPVIIYADELKIVFDGKKPKEYGIMANHYYLQPCDTGYIRPNKEINQKLVEYVKGNPIWKISIQGQKILKVR